MGQTCRKTVDDSALWRGLSINNVIGIGFSLGYKQRHLQRAVNSVTSTGFSMVSFAEGCEWFRLHRVVNSINCTGLLTVSFPEGSQKLILENVSIVSFANSIIYREYRSFATVFNSFICRVISKCVIWRVLSTKSFAEGCQQRHFQRVLKTVICGIL